MSYSRTRNLDNLNIKMASAESVLRAGIVVAWIFASIWGLVTLYAAFQLTEFGGSAWPGVLAAAMGIGGVWLFTSQLQAIASISEWVRTIRYENERMADTLSSVATQLEKLTGEATTVKADRRPEPPSQRYGESDSPTGRFLTMGDVRSIVERAVETTRDKVEGITSDAQTKLADDRRAFGDHPAPESPLTEADGTALQPDDGLGDTRTESEVIADSIPTPSGTAEPATEIIEPPDDQVPPSEPVVAGAADAGTALESIRPTAMTAAPESLRIDAADVVSEPESEAEGQFCGGCGSELKSGARFCSKCGTAA